ncbi:MAG: sigma-70 family RNA polymerase sigma factor [Firmicutes bacterium]|nr:sigma-70 family RNA polymerase sigma factor [Bacillota bacterium]HOB35447.1 sigma-70 family RNA polymerase sigma factor [Bacillota bacterium]HPZ89758.1 sigma-70 family RNA polymerase sigma factor [Bacillota bacterium]HQE01226.1 sigma-70 family RNA polymerase sigma factor [Bacillota bacterium]
MKQISEALPPLADAAARELLARAQAGDGAARELLVRHNLLLVKKVAARFAGAEQWEDLFQVGCIGLLKAIDDFDLSRDASFSTYAVPRIVGEIRMYLRDNNLLKVSRDLLRTSALVKKCRQQLEQEYGREPTVGEVAAALNLAAEEVAAAETAAAAPVGLEQVHAAETMDEVRVALKEMIGRLETRERQVIVLRFFRDLSQAEVARKLGISQGHVSRIERGVLAKLRAAMA